MYLNLPLRFAITSSPPYRTRPLLPSSYSHHPHCSTSTRYPSLMQRPTCTEIRVRSVSDALVIFYAVSKGILPIVSRRLDSEERRCIRSGSVYVWEERGPDAEATGVSLSSLMCLIPLTAYLSSGLRDGQMEFVGDHPVLGSYETLCRIYLGANHLFSPETSFCSIARESSTWN
jgi:hypothetical protein